MTAAGEAWTRPGQRARDALTTMASALRAAGVDTPELDARLLLLHALGMSHARLIGEPSRPLSDAEAAALDDLLKRRLGGEPVSRIMGRREFFGREFVINRHVLDPRPDTETLVEAALEATRVMGNDAPFIIDAGTGSGAIIITLLAELPGARGLAIDKSLRALKVAAENARRIGVSERLLLARGDWLAAVREGTCDLLVSNPPYIASGEIPTLPREVAGHDPLQALDGGADGLCACRRLADQAGKVVRRGGFALVEVGAGQANEVMALFEAGGFSPSSRPGPLISDLAGVERVVALRKK